MKSILLYSFLLVFTIISVVNSAFSQDTLLYRNDFESPLITPIPSCNPNSPDVDQTPVNTLFGGTGTGIGGDGIFLQVFTVETILINGPDDQYTDDSGVGGDYCLGMLSSGEDDKLALIFDSQMLPFLNVSFVVSPIDLAGCGGPFGLDTSKIDIKVYDSPNGIFSFNSPGILLDQDTLKGKEPGATPFTMNWASVSTSLDISNSTDGNITVVFDAIQSGYLVFDNIEIKSSLTTSTQEINEDSNLAIYPNPIHNELNINGLEKNGTVIIYDLLGQIIHIQNPLSSQIQIDTKNWLSGVYYLNYSLKNKVNSYKVIKN